jgi:hypothetical protein
MKNEPSKAAVGASVVDPAYANILTSLMSGRPLTATERAHETGIAAATATGPIAKRLDGYLLLVKTQGRHCDGDQSADHCPALRNKYHHPMKNTPSAPTALPSAVPIR